MPFFRPVVEYDVTHSTRFRFCFLAAAVVLPILITLTPASTSLPDHAQAASSAPAQPVPAKQAQVAAEKAPSATQNATPAQAAVETAKPAPQPATDASPPLPLAVFTGGIETESEAAGPTPSWRISGILAKAGPEQAGAENGVRVLKAYVRPGDTVASILSGLLGGADIEALGTACNKIYPLNRIQIGREYAVSTRNGAFESLSYDIDQDRRLLVEKTEGEFRAFEQAIEYEQSVARIEGAIESSLFGALEGAGESPELALALADIFACEIDFIRDLREGDSFQLLVEKRSQQGAFKCYGKILAATFTNQGQTYEGYLVEDAKGKKNYYDASGKNLRKAFLRAPLKFTRISSGYTLRRKHPILNVVRPHLGVDYAAPAGTPVMAVGDGVVRSAGWNSGGGKTIKLAHANDYNSTYMHLSRFAAGIRKGKRVSQGEVIGYVGATGLATGPHLDFRLEHRGQFLNPQKQLAKQPAPSLPAREMEAFRKTVAELRARLRQDQSSSAPLAFFGRSEKEAGRAL